MIGLNYVSCSPYRVPIARLAAARAALSHKAPVAAKTTALGKTLKKSTSKRKGSRKR
jgi:pyruvate,orthophosphate dikinase